MHSLALIIKAIELSFTTTLAVAAWLTGARGRLDQAFAIFAASLALAGGTSFIADESQTALTFEWLLRVSVIFHSLVPLAIIYYVLVLSGIIDDFSRKIWGIQARSWVWTIVGSIVCMLVIFQIPNAAFLGYERTAIGTFKPIFREIVGLAMLPLGILICGGCPLFLTAGLRDAQSASQRRFIKTNLIALLIRNHTAGHSSS
jgi:hypothetical protein